MHCFLDVGGSLKISQSLLTVKIALENWAGTWLLNVQFARTVRTGAKELPPIYFVTAIGIIPDIIYLCFLSNPNIKP